MATFERVLEQLAVDLLNEGAGIPEPLSGVLRNTRGKDLLSLSLESVRGPLLTIGRLDFSNSRNERNHRALPSLSECIRGEKRFFFSITDSRWEVLSAFSCGSCPYFTTLSLDVSSGASAPLRSGLFKLADFFTVRCRKMIFSYITDLSRPVLSQAREVPEDSFEISVLRKVTAFSEAVQCAVLLDEDGFIIHAEGRTGPVDELGGALARLFYRSNHEISRSDCTECNAITLSDPEYTIQIGRLPGTSLALAISVSGPYAAAGAHFLHTAASGVLTGYARSTGKLWGVSLAVTPEPARIRTSWFSPPSLVPHGKFVGKRGGKSFHTVTCQILSKTDAALLQWFESRAVAIQSGLRPCGACNP